MKPMRNVTTGNVTRRQNFLVLMESVFPSFGSVTTTMTAGMAAMSQLISAGTRIVPQAGEDVQVTLITDVYQNGSSVMAKMTAEMEPMNWQRTVQNVRKKETSNVETKDVFQKDGSVILKTTVEITLMRMMKCAQEGTGNVQSQSSDVETIHVRMANSSVSLVIVLRKSLDVTATRTAMTCLTNWTVHQDTQMENIAQITNLSVRIISAFDTVTSVTKLMIVVTERMSLLSFVTISLVTRCRSSSVATASASQNTRCVTVWLTAKMPVTKTI